MRTVPPGLQDHLNSEQTTLCYLIKIIPQKAPAFGICSLDQDITFNDGGGDMVYSSIIGVNTESFQSSGDLSVDNTQAMILISTTLTKEDITAGVLDYAKYVVYRINWKDTSEGHYLVTSGTTGIVRSSDSLSGVIELRGLSQSLKQNYHDLYSLNCRADFGSQPGDEEKPCMFDASGLWQNNSVASVDATDPDMIFTATITPASTGPNGPLPFDTALILFTSGKNSGLTVETETVISNDITLRFNAPYAPEVGDTFDIRPDCAKRYQEDCIDKFDNKLWFRGEPLIDLTEEAKSQSPGANVPGSLAPILPS